MDFVPQSDIPALRAAEGSARRDKERLAEAAEVAAKEHRIASLRRERAELWERAAQLRAELISVENRAAAISL